MNFLLERRSLFHVVPRFDASIHDLIADAADDNCLHAVKHSVVPANGRGEIGAVVVALEEVKPA
jgi:hypothetical protein